MKLDKKARTERMTASSDTGNAVLLYLPGITLTGAAISAQLPDLRAEFDVHSLVVPADDQTDMHGLADIVAATISENDKDGRPTYLVGDSFGGVLALLVALRTPKPPPGLRGLILINPATSFELSFLPSLLPALDALSSAPPALSQAAYAPLQALALGATLGAPRPDQLQQFTSFAAAIPLPTLQFRLRALRDAAAIVSSPKVLARLTLPVQLFVAGEDRLFPSADEGRRLARDLPNARLRLLPTAGHALLLDASVSLGDLLRSSGLTERRARSRTDYINAFRPPSEESVANASASLQTIRRLASPVFLSTTAGGRRVAGVAALKPLLRNRQARAAEAGAAEAGTAEAGAAEAAIPPVLLVGNHQLIGPDISLLIDEIYRTTGVLVRGLSHPSNFRVSADSGGGDGGTNAGASEGFGNFNARFGAVPVSSRALYKLMARGDSALLYPGGLREAFKSTKRGEAYKLFWPDAAGSADGSFARVAAKFDATIVPFAAVGADESVEMLLDTDDLLALPVVGARALETARRTPVALPGERFITPISIPAPWRFRRFYFFLGKPIDTSGVDPDDRAACAALYEQAKADVEQGVQFLLERRKADPYESFLPRAAVEASWNFSRQVPSFAP